MAFSRALTRPNLTHLLRPNHSRCIRISTNKEPNTIINPFQISGPKGAEATKIDYMGLHIRIDMPGVGDDSDFKLSVEKEKGLLVFEAKAPYDRREKDVDYFYKGAFKVPTVCYKLDQIKAKLKDGVLRILLPLKY